MLRQIVRTRLGAILMAALAGAPTLAAERPVLVLNDTNEPPYTTAAADGFIDIVAGEAFRRVGVTLKLTKLPPERGLVNANAGVEDGDIVRIAGLEKQYPNLIRVPEKLIDWEFAAFSKNGTIRAEWPELRKRSVAHIKGWKIYEKAMEGVPEVVTANDPEQLMRLLELNRVDVVLYERWLGLALLQKQKMSDARSLSPSLAKREMFIYLHRRHEALVPKLAQSLRDLKRDGFYQRVYDQKLAPYRKAASP